MTSASDTVDIVSSTAEKHLGISEGASLKKHSKKVAPEQAMDASGSTTRPPRGSFSAEVVGYLRVDLGVD
ncbi:hypothetical protein GW17_00020835 [Ensete ventricosum]|nr:hypothetical protein GW17_00020835 [Ensete ventricosum]